MSSSVNVVFIFWLHLNLSLFLSLVSADTLPIFFFSAQIIYFFPIKIYPSHAYFLNLNVKYFNETLLLLLIFESCLKVIWRILSPHDDFNKDDFVEPYWDQKTKSRVVYFCHLLAIWSLSGYLTSLYFISRTGAVTSFSLTGFLWVTSLCKP